MKGLIKKVSEKKTHQNHIISIHYLITVNPLTPMSDQDRISPKKTNMISSRQEMRIKKKSIRGLSVDPIPNSPK